MPNAGAISVTGTDYNPNPNPKAIGRLHLPFEYRLVARLAGNVSHYSHFGECVQYGKHYFMGVDASGLAANL
jgi:hypothetical protein